MTTLVLTPKTAQTLVPLTPSVTLTPSSLLLPSSDGLLAKS